MSEYFLEPKSSGRRVKVELNLSNYTTKADLKNATGVNTSKFAKKVDLAHLKGKILDITNLATNTILNAKTNEAKNKISNIFNLAATTALTGVENKIPNVSNLVKKTDYNTKISEIENKVTTDHDHDKYITTQEFNKLTSEDFTARLKKANLASEIDVANLVKKTDLNKN